jgi:hypothetical protein
MALINQKAGRQGNVNPALYALAAKQSTSACNSSAPASTCVFNDVTVGTNSAPCEFGVSPNCTRTDSSDSVGSLTGYNAGTGYDLTTGLGSMNVANLVNSFTASTGGVGSFTVGPASGTATVSSPGSSTTYALTVTGTNGFAGTVTFSCTGLPADAFCSATPATLSATTTSATSTLTITTTAATALLPPAPGGGGSANHNAPLLAGTSQHLLGPTLAMLLIFCAAVFLFAPKNNTRQATAVFALMVFGMVFIASCGGSSGGGGGGSSGTPTGNSTVTVTASSGGTTAATTFTLTVN